MTDRRPIALAAVLRAREAGETCIGALVHLYHLVITGERAE